MPGSVECPHCHAMNVPPSSTIGQYITCSRCRTKFYVYVPPLAADREPEPLIERAAHQKSPTPPRDRSESSVLMRQESLLATIHEDLLRLRRQIAVACFVFVAGGAAVVATVLLR